MIRSHQEAINILSTLKITILYYKKLPKGILVDLHVSVCSLVNIGPILDFKVSTDS